MSKILIITTLFIGSLFIALGFNLFIIPHQLLSGGVSGIAMITGYFTGGSISVFYLLLNLPLIIWGWMAIGRSFIIYSIISILCVFAAMQLIPVDTVTNDVMLGAVFGGVFVGVGTGLSLRVGGSTGGFDIIGSILTKKWDFPLGTVLMLLNGIVILGLGELKNWDLALSSMLSIFITGKVIDTIHIRHIKITAFIVTNEREKLLQKMLVMPHGVTVLKTRGAYSDKEKDMLMTVTTRYELSELKKIIHETDPGAFVNLVETAGIIGQFRRL